MSSKESQRALMLENVKTKVISLNKAASLLNLSYSQTKRLWSAFKKKGPEGLVSKKRGKRSNRAVSEKKREEIAVIIRENYHDCKPLFTSEKLDEYHNLKYSSEFIRQLMIEHHLWVPKKSKKQIHQRRKRRDCYGELVQLDASDHEWFEDRGARSHLHLLIDDATSMIVAGYFTLEETTEGYFRACMPYFKKEGVPLSLYHDKRGTFVVNHGKNRNETQFSRAMKELGVEMITAHSPQAKGRIERVFGTLQDRLVWEMRIKSISSIEDANKYLPCFIKKHNERYAIEPTSPFNAHQQLKQSKNLKYILGTKEYRIVSKNLEISHKNEVYQLLSSKDEHLNLKGTKVEVITTLEGEILIQYKGQKIKYCRYSQESNKEKEVKVTQKKSKKKAVRDPKKQENFSKAVEERGYIERDEILSVEEKKSAELRLQERIMISRQENLEILEGFRDGTDG